MTGREAKEREVYVTSRNTKGRHTARGRRSRNFTAGQDREGMTNKQRPQSREKTHRRDTDRERQHSRRDMLGKDETEEIKKREDSGKKKTRRGK